MASSLSLIHVRSFSKRVLSIPSMQKTKFRLDNIYFGSSNPSVEQKEQLFANKSRIHSDVQMLSLYYLHLQRETDFETEGRNLVKILEKSKNEAFLREFSRLLQYYFYSALNSKESSKALQELWENPVFKASGLGSQVTPLYSEAVLRYGLDPKSLIEAYDSLPLSSLNLVDSSYYLIALYKAPRSKVYYSKAKELYDAHHQSQASADSTWVPLYALLAFENEDFLEAQCVPLQNGNSGCVNVKLKMLSSGKRFHEGSLLLRSKYKLKLSDEVFQEWKEGMLHFQGGVHKEDLKDIIQSRILNGHISIVPSSLSELVIDQIYKYFK